MKLLLLSSLLALAAAPAVLAQAPAKATVKTKTKPVGQASVKTKTKTTAVPEPAAPEPDAAMVDTKSNALTANMQKNLGLTPQQTEKVRAINRRSIEAVEAAHLRHRADPRKLAGVIESVSSSRLSAIKDVLTPTQFGKYQRKREEKMGVPNVQGVQGTPPPGLGGGAGDQ
jgi:glutamate synthase domain-containing protein 1